MTPVDPGRWGDPASVSALAAELARAAEELDQARSSLGPERLPDVPGLGAEELLDRLGSRVHRMARTAAALREAVTALQQHVADVQQARAQALSAEDAVSRATDAAALQEAMCLGEAAEQEGADAARRLAARLAAATGGVAG